MILDAPPKSSKKLEAPKIHNCESNNKMFKNVAALFTLIFIVDMDMYLFIFDIYC